MSNYLQGLIYEVGGMDIDREKENKRTLRQDQKKDTYKLDWSFLHKNLPPKKRT
ncbi:MAG: hypothetical protein ACLGHN_02185 [Bacteriovoracia bacterium]